MTKVLIVDDEELLNAAYSMGLTKAGYKVFTVERAAGALDIIKNEKPDIILIDMLMPDMNGVELMKKLKNEHLLGKAKIIAFSNIENPAVMSATKKLGAIEYLLKVNYTPAQLAEYLDKL